MSKDNQRPDNNLKAEIALRKLDGESLSKLANEFGVSESYIKKWTETLRKKATLLYSEELSGCREQSDRDFTKSSEFSSLLHTALEVSPNGLMVVDLDGRIITYNERYKEMWGIPDEILETGKIQDAMDYVIDQIVDGEEYERKVYDLYEDPEVEVKDTVEFKDGRIFKRYSIPYRTGSRIKGRVTSFTDITGYIKRGRKIREYGELLESITTNVNEGILRSTPDKGLIYVNEAFVEIFGYDSREEVLSTDPQDFYADKSRRKEVMEQLEQEGKIVNEEILFKRKDGSTFWGLENSTLVRSETQTYIDGVVNDISQRKNAEQAVRESEEKYRTILKNIEEGYFETDLAGNLTFFNESLSKMLGYPEEELLGMNNREFMDEENAEKVYKTFNRTYRTGVPERGFDWELIRKDGSRIFVETSLNLRVNAEREPIGFRGVARDITDRKEKERQIRDSLKEKEALLGEIHHRVKNNLAVISGLLYLQAEKTDDEAVSKAFMNSQSRINSMATVHEMLYRNRTFSSIDPGEYIKELVDNIRENFVPKGKEITTEVHSDEIQVKMSKAIPCALIVNELLTNAFKYAFVDRDGGSVEISVRKRGDNVELVVGDDGVGMNEDVEGKDSDKGLGLFLVNTLVRQINGELEIEREDGTRFIISFPADSG